MKKFKLDKKSSKRMITSLAIGASSGAFTAFSLLTLSAMTHIDVNEAFAKSFITVITCAIGVITIPISNWIIKSEEEFQNIERKIR